MDSRSSHAGQMGRRGDHGTWISSSTFVALYTLIERTKSSFSRGNKGSSGALIFPELPRGCACWGDSIELRNVFDRGVVVTETGISGW